MTPTPRPNSPDPAPEPDWIRKRATRLFKFLKAYAELKQPRVGSLAAEEWSLALAELPQHAAIELLPAEGLRETGSTLLRVRRASVAPAPAPPVSLQGWLEEGWQDPTRPLRVLEPDEAAGAELDAWAARRARWAEEQAPAWQAQRIYDALFEMKGKLDREGERIELIAGNGRLRMQTAEQLLDYPILIQRVELVFHARVPEFEIRDADREPELNRAVLEQIPGIRGDLLRKLQTELEESAFHPLDRAETPGWLGEIIHQLTPGGELQSEPASADPGSAPALFDAPVLVLRRRSAGVPEAMERALQALSERQVPFGLQRILGVDKPAQHGAWSGPSAFDLEGALLSKPANEQQLDLVRQLETDGAVLVQGPPGTGKSHTIANLIGHLIATGQRVLVTSQTIKALRVLRGHVPPKLQPLCVSILGDDQEGRRQLEEAINHIQRGIKTPSDGELARAERELAERRAHLSRTILEGRRRLLAIRHLECTPIVFGGEELRPLDAARLVRERAEQDGWIPGPVASGVPCPLSEPELAELYATQASLSAGEELELGRALPLPGELPPAREFRALVELCTAAPALASEALFGAPAQLGSGEACAELAREIGLQLRVARQFQPWKREVVCAALGGPASQAGWQELVELIEESASTYRNSRKQLIDLEPELPAWDEHELERVLGALVQATRGSRSPGRLVLGLHPSWKRFVAEARVLGRSPRQSGEFLALQAAFELSRSRRRLARRWNAILVPLGLAPVDALDPRAEEACLPLASDVRQCLSWWKTAVEPLLERAAERKLSWPALRARIDRGTGALAELEHGLQSLELAQAALSERAQAERVLAARQRMDALEAYLAGFGGSAATVLRRAAAERSCEAWDGAHAQLAELYEKRPVFARRRALLAKLAGAAAAWAAQIVQRRGPHARPRAPGDGRQAWRWIQLDQELQARSGAEERALADELQGDAQRQLELTVELIDRRCWQALRARTGVRQQQALVGWADTMRKVGKGTGKRAPQLLAEAREQLRLARDAVPVWIMPLARVFETIDPLTSEFDVVIVDEASQADISALFAVFLGARVVIVGDHEQVSPEAVGQRADEVGRLIDLHLADIPNAVLYDGQTSIYDLARQSFPGQLRLVEHFRCVREIVEFSNRLSYNGEILPLRDAADALAPHLVEQRVPGVRDEGLLNPRESEEVASLIAAAIEQPEYAGKSFGVVSLLGDEQAMSINALLLRHLRASEIEDRKLLCGNAAHFQGDERDVMFATMVDSSAGAPLPRKAIDMFKKRYNVAASRARDQLWLVHSLDTAVDLKAGDLRLRLIQHVRDPGLRQPGELPRHPAAESRLEQDLVQRLAGAGYRLETQHEVGACRIDIVVEGSERRIALECDGEQFHGLEELAQDMNRQLILERLGWRFLRMRGSRFYRDPEAAMRWLTRQLDELGIQPLGPTPPASPKAARAAQLVERVRRRAAELRAGWLAG